MKGYGRLYDSETGDVYMGEFVNAKRHGNGKFYSKDHDNIYDGSWINDKKNGKGKQISRDGKIKLGDYRNNLIEGH
eukprot:CAMPEP_0176339338 /NCGR_PEP_ID=MMETSP0126-20121128/688_1 /TAXON_ID=141414 ORGANISM="Strombidinopsis acuminatum, Strain SPMC142" /NCGR_SAMPLE_ID=MMETSP0126 /ASSEMBLY_ACC=CAM_ASM_000229 /LENGTH=75 /DNA_ID=CAMNT_0017682875 /DNA_START=177 /DNA_END=404 /DNA_ORIENTATION=-